LEADIANSPAPTELLKGTLDLLILRTLELEPMHGVAIADRIAQTTRGTFQVKPGSLFPALHRLEQEGWIDGHWQQSEGGRRVKSYALSRAGRRQLTTEKAQWRKIVLAMNQVLDSP
jgi:PadR family transcriptional regulator PadR